MHKLLIGRWRGWERVVTRKVRACWVLEERGWRCSRGHITERQELTTCCAASPLPTSFTAPPSPYTASWQQPVYPPANQRDLYHMFPPLHFSSCINSPDVVALLRVEVLPVDTSLTSVGRRHFDGKGQTDPLLNASSSVLSLRGISWTGTLGANCVVQAVRRQSS